MVDRPRARLSAAEKVAAAGFIVSIVAAIGLFIVYWTGGQTQLEGILLCLVLGGLGVGIVIFAKRFLPQGPFTEPRGRISSTPEEIDAFVADFEAGGEGIARRRFLARLGAAALGGLGLAALF